MAIPIALAACEGGESVAEEPVPSAGPAWIGSVSIGERAAAVIHGEDGHRIGAAIAVLGDRNGDGFPELAVGVPFATTSAPEAGEVWIFDGPLAGELRREDASAILSGREPFAAFGWSLTETDDLDGDGLRELVVGAYAASETADSGGAVYIFDERLRGELDATDAAVVLRGALPDERLGWSVAACSSGQSAQALWLGAYSRDSGARLAAGGVHRVERLGPSGIVAEPTLSGTSDGHYLGWSVHCADIDQDGALDLVAGGRSDGGIGGSEVLFGDGTRREVATGPGFARVRAFDGGFAVGSWERSSVDGYLGARGRSGDPTWTASMSDSSELWGWSLDACNRDGRNLLAVAAPGSDAGALAAGRVALLDRNTGVELAELVGNAAFDGLGTGVACADLNNDGQADLVVGADGASLPDGEDTGAVYVVY